MLAGSGVQVMPETVSSASTVKVFVVSVLFLALLTIAAVVTLSIMVPNNNTIITIVIGITSPLMIALLGAGLQGMASSVDGKMAQLLEATAEKERLRGLVEGLKVNPLTNVK